MSNKYLTHEKTKITFVERAELGKFELNDVPQTSFAFKCPLQDNRYLK